MQNTGKSIQVFGTTIAYTVDRSSRRRNITIEIRPEGKAVVKAPMRAADGEIEGIVKDNARWILGKLAEAGRSKPAKAERRFVDGECFPFLGNDLTLRIVEATTGFPVGEVKLGDGTVVVSAFLEMAASDPLSSVRSPLVNWYQQQAANYFPIRAAHFAKLFDVEVGQVLIRDQRRRWGSCNAHGELRFCYRLIMAPPDVVDYVIAHEVCHLLEMNHSAAYWEILGEVMPDYKARRHELKRIGGTLLL